MKRFALTLKLDNKKKHFKPLKEVTIDVLNHSIQLENMLKAKVDRYQALNQCLQYVCAVFGHRFTLQDLERNVEVDEIIPLTMKTIEYVTATAGLKLPEFHPRGEVVPFVQRPQS